MTGANSVWNAGQFMSATDTSALSLLRDPDRDGLSNLWEYHLSTNPKRKDSDFDGVNDGVEVAWGTQPGMATNASLKPSLADHPSFTAYPEHPITATGGSTSVIGGGGTGGGGSVQPPLVVLPPEYTEDFGISISPDGILNYQFRLTNTETTINGETITIPITGYHSYNAPDGSLVSEMLSSPMMDWSKVYPIIGSHLMDKIAYGFEFLPSSWGGMMAEGYWSRYENMAATLGARYKDYAEFAGKIVTVTAPETASNSRTFRCIAVMRTFNSAYIGTDHAQLVEAAPVKFTVPGGSRWANLATWPSVVQSSQGQVNFGMQWITGFDDPTVEGIASGLWMTAGPAEPGEQRQIGLFPVDLDIYLPNPQENNELVERDDGEEDDADETAIIFRSPYDANNKLIVGHQWRTQEVAALTIAPTTFPMEDSAVPAFRLVFNAGSGSDRRFEVYRNKSLSTQVYAYNTVFPDIHSLTTLYIKPLRGSASSGETITLQVRINNRWIDADEVKFRLLPVSFVAHEISGGGVITPNDTQVQASAPSPIVNVFSCSLDNVRVDEVGKIVGDVTIVGDLSSRACDSLPGDAGIIDTVQFYANGQSEPIENVAVSVSKGTGTQLGKEFPYAGSFNKKIHDVPLVAGNNVFKIAAQDKVFNLPGFHTWTAEVRVIESEDGEVGEGLLSQPQDAPSTTPSSLELTVALPIQNELTNAQVLPTVLKEGNETVESFTMAETEAGSRLFNSSVGSQGYMLQISEEPVLAADKRDVIVVNWNNGDEASGSVRQIRLLETTNDSGVFSGGIVAAAPVASDASLPPSDSAPDSGGLTVEADYPTPLEQSNGGELHQYAIEFKIATDVLDSLPEIIVTIEGQRFKVLKNLSLQKAILCYADGPMADKPAVITYRMSDQGIAVEVDPDVVVNKLVANNATFESGFATGLTMGGVDMVTGLGTMAMKTSFEAGKAVVMASLGVSIAGKMVYGSDSSQEKQIFNRIVMADYAAMQQKVSMGKSFWNLAQLAGQSEVELHETILKMLAAVAEGGDVGEIAGQSEVVSKIVEFCAETIPQMWEDMGNAHPAKKGYYTGRLVFEVASFLLPYAKANTLQKVTKLQCLKWLTKESTVLRRAPGAAAKTATLITELELTKMCFLAGTKVLTKTGLKNIEHVDAGDLVWSRDEFTQEQGWRPVVQTFVTHPSELYHLTYELRGPPDGGASTSVVLETLGVTAPHPFWVLNRDQPKFLPAEDLHPGDLLCLADGGTALVRTKTLEAKPEGECFTTYNFEVAQFHTYFVGQRGVWVHNEGISICERIFSTFTNQLRAIVKETGASLNNARFTALKATRGKLGKLIPGPGWDRTAAANGQIMLDDVAAGRMSREALPSVEQWIKEFFKLPKGKGRSGVDVHHSVEKYIQELLGINPKAYRNGIEIGDSCPGVPLPRNKAELDILNADLDEARRLKAIHKGMDNGGISGILQSKIKKGNPDNLSPQAILKELRDIHVRDHPEFENVWKAAREWLRDLQQSGHLDPTLTIP